MKKHIFEIVIIILLLTNLFFVLKGDKRMADVILPNIDKANNVSELKEILSMQQKQIEFLLANLDSKNVKQINTNITNIKSADGSTRIDGNTLVMTDTTQPRLKMGYNKDTGLFEFIIYDENGSKTFEVDSTGEAVFKGSITTEKNAIVGNNLYIGNAQSLGTQKYITLNENCVISSDQFNDFEIANLNVGGDVNLRSNSKIGLKCQSGEINLNSSFLGFFGYPGVQQQTLPATPTTAQIRQVLLNYGLVN